MTKEELEKKLEEDIKSGKITVDEAEDEWQDFTHRGENVRGW